MNQTSDLVGFSVVARLNHCYLAPYWSGKLNRSNMQGFQVSERTGIAKCESAENSRVLLEGKAING